MTTKIIELNGIKISYTFYHPDPEYAVHPKPQVVFINGLADDQHTWQPQLQVLHKAGYPALVFDNRGVGASSRPPGQYTAELLASDCKALLDALGIRKPFHLLGVSMGGMIAQSYALKHPQDILSLTLACTYAKPNDFCLRMFGFWADVAKKMNVATVMRDVTAWAFTPAFFEPGKKQDLDEVDGAMAAIDINTDEYLSQLNVIQAFDTTHEVHKLSNLRVLVLAGIEDILIPTALSHDLHRRITGSEWRTVKGGHACLWEFPDDFNQAMLQFLESSNS